MVSFFIFVFIWINGWFFLLAWASGLFDSPETPARKHRESIIQYRERKDREFEAFKQENIRKLEERIKEEHYHEN